MQMKVDMNKAVADLLAIGRQYGVPEQVLRQYIHQWLVAHLAEHHDYETDLTDALKQIYQLLGRPMNGCLQVQLQNMIYQVLNS